MGNAPEPGWRQVAPDVWRCEFGPLARSAGTSLLEAVPGVVEAWTTPAGAACVVAPGFDPALLPPAASFEAVGPTGREHVVPVDYSAGPDLEEAAAELGVGPEELARAHSAGEYWCESLGFAPGFAYLGPLPPPLDRLPRRPSPRPRVEAGAVAVAAGRTAVYPGGTPGGWWLVGRTPLRVCEWEAGHFPVQPGDRVRFLPVSAEEARAWEGKSL